MLELLNVWYCKHSSSWFDELWYSN